MKAVSNLFNSTSFGSKIVEAFSQRTLNAFLELSSDCWHEVRLLIQSLLTHSNSILRKNPELMNTAFKNIEDVTLHLPFKVFPDFRNFV